MMYRRLIQVVGGSFLLLAPQSTLAQFGIAGKKRQGDFQELQKQAAEAREEGEQAGEAANEIMNQMNKLMQDAMKNPELMKTFEGLAGDFAKNLDEFGKLSPEEIETQMNTFWESLIDGSIVDQVVTKREAVLKTLEQTGAVPAEELEKFKADPAYFELKMRESFSDMEGMFKNKDYMDTVKGMHSALNNPDMVKDTIKEQLSSDDQIEELRLLFLKGDHPMAAMFATEELQAILKDPVKFKETLNEGLSALLGGADGGGAVPKSIEDTIKHEL